jgi:hypothetical protein
MQVRFTASATDGLWLHIKDGPGFCLGKLAPETTSVGWSALNDLYEALLADGDCGVSPYFDVTNPAGAPATERPPLEELSVDTECTNCGQPCPEDHPTVEGDYGYVRLPVCSEECKRELESQLDNTVE